MTRLLKIAAEKDLIISIGAEKVIKTDENGKQYVCRRFDITNTFIGDYITEKMYQKMVEREIILKVETEI